MLLTWSTSHGVDRARRSLISQQSATISEEGLQGGNNNNDNSNKPTTTMATAPAEFLLELPCKILFWEIASQKWRGGKKGTIFLVPFDNHEKTQVVFKPKGEEATTMWYVDDLAELRGGMRAKIHQALSIQRHVDDTRSIVFGKAASRSYVNEDGKPIKTAWVARFEEFWEANAFSFMLNCLLERNGRFSSFSEQNNDAALEKFYANGKEEYDTEDDKNENDEEDSDNDYRVTGYAIEEEESSQEEELDDLVPARLRDIDTDTALRIRRRMTQPDASSEYEEEVAESQNLF
jgi:hypothetical protein